MRLRRSRNMRHTGVKYMLAGGTVVTALFGTLINPSQLLPSAAPKKDVCQEVVQSSAVLSRDQLSQLLTIPERAQKDAVRQIMKEPYCKLADVNIRADVGAQREAYPLAFDLNTWLVVLYEGDEYAGYAFSFR